MFQQNISKQQQKQSIPYGQNLNFSSRPLVPTSKTFLQNSNILQKIQPSYNNASSTIVKPTQAFSSNFRINQPQQYVPINLNSTTYLGTNTNQIIQSRIQPHPQYNNALMLMQPVENTSFSNGFSNNNALGNNLSTLRFQGTVTPQSRIFQNEKRLENKFLQEKSVNRNATLNESINYSTAVAVKQNNNSKLRLLTGTAEKIIKWHKMYRNHFCYYELVAPIVSIQEGTVRLQKVLILRDRRGPIIQVVYYVNDHINIQNFFVGQTLRCVGHMVGPNIMHGLSIREARSEEITTLNRMCYISEHAIAKAINKS